MNSMLQNTLWYKNNFSLGTATYAGSFAIKFAAGQTPGMQQNTWTGFQTTYTGVLPGAVLELPYPRAVRHHHAQRRQPAVDAAGVELRHQRDELDGDVHHRQLAHPVAHQRHGAHRGRLQHHAEL